MAARYDPRKIDIEVSDQTGRVWKGVPGFGTEISAQPPRGRHEIVLEKGSKPPAHKEYAARRRLFEFLEASYKGGSAYKNAKDAEGMPVFIEHETESPQAAKRRKRLSTYRNYCRVVVDKFRAFVFGCAITRDAEDERFEEWSEDVDDNGTPLSEFMEQCMQKALILGKWFAIVDTSKQDDYETQAQAKARGNKMLLSCLHPARVINWNEDESELLVRHDGVGQNGEVWLWSETGIVRCPLNDKGEIEAIGPEEPHGWTRMPIICFNGLNPGESLISDVAEMNKAIFNDDSLLREEQAKQIFSQHFICGIGADAMTDESSVAIGSRKFICIKESAQTVRIDRISGDQSMSESIRQTIEIDEKEIYRMVGLRMPDVLQGPESGRALRIRQAETVAIAERIADNAEAAEDRIVQFYNEATGSDVEDPSYPDDFDEEDLAATLKETLDLVGSGVGPLLKAEAIIAYIRQKFTDMEPEERAELEAEAREGAEEAKLLKAALLKNANGEGAEGEEDEDEDEKGLVKARPQPIEAKSDFPPKKPFPPKGA